MSYANLVEPYLRMLQGRQLARLEAELWKFAEPLDQLLHALLSRPSPDWRDQLDAFLAWQESEGRRPTPESLQSILDYLTAWAAAIGLDDAEPQRDAPNEPPEDARGPSTPPVTDNPMGGYPETFGPLFPAFQEELDRNPPVPPLEFLPPRLVESRPRIVEIKPLKGIWTHYDELVASGDYDSNWLENAFVGIARQALPSSQPGLKITFDDGTILILDGGGPDSRALAEQAEFLITAGSAAAGKATLRATLEALTKHLSREAAEDIAVDSAHEASGVPVPFIPSKRTRGSKRKSIAPKAAAKTAPSTKGSTVGGTYVLRDPKTGRVMRTGRSKNLTVRKRQLARDPKTRHLEFEIDKRTDDYFQQRGREQIIHDEHRPPMNRINPIYPKNSNRQKYLDSAKEL